MTLLISALFLKKIPKILITGDITYNWLYLYMTLRITANKKHICNFAFISFISEFNISMVFITIVIVSLAQSVQPPLTLVILFIAKLTQETNLDARATL